jgi:hypothetical protein
VRTVGVSRAGLSAAAAIRPPSHSSSWLVRCCSAINRSRRSLVSSERLANSWSTRRSGGTVPMTETICQASPENYDCIGCRAHEDRAQSGSSRAMPRIPLHVRGVCRVASERSPLSRDRLRRASRMQRRSRRCGPPSTASDSYCAGRTPLCRSASPDFRRSLRRDRPFGPRPPPQQRGERARPRPRLPPRTARDSGGVAHQPAPTHHLRSRPVTRVGQRLRVPFRGAR